MCIRVNVHETCATRGLSLLILGPGKILSGFKVNEIDKIAPKRIL